MSYLLWQRAGAARIASSSLVLRAGDVPLLRDAEALCAELRRLHDREAARIAAAAEEAREQGRAEGRAEGHTAAEAETAARVAALVEAAAAERARLRDEVGALALQVVRKLLGAFADDEILLALADRAAQDVLGAEPIALTVHPEVADAVRARMAARAEAGTGSALCCEVRSDAALPRDGCRLETSFGRIDAGLEAQLARLEAVWAQTAQADAGASA